MCSGRLFNYIKYFCFLHLECMEQSLGRTADSECCVDAHAD